MFVAMMQECLKVTHSGVTTGKSVSVVCICSSGHVRPVSETAYQVCFSSLVKRS